MSILSPFFDEEVSGVQRTADGMQRVQFDPKTLERIQNEKDTYAAAFYEVNDLLNDADTYLFGDVISLGNWICAHPFYSAFFGCCYWLSEYDVRDLARGKAVILEPHDVNEAERELLEQEGYYA